jgi:cytosine/adenosine deaminase-related metal-dependent hydrolase
VISSTENNGPRTITIVPDWLVPIESPSLEEGFLVLHDGEVAFVGDELPAKFQSIPCVRLNGIAVLPGLVNAHCHLEFSDLTTPIASGPSFPSWIRRLIDYRNSESLDATERAEARRKAIAKGINESYATGVRWIVDMTTQPWSHDWTDWNRVGFDQTDVNRGGNHMHPPIVVQPCIELIDITPQRYQQTKHFSMEQCHAPPLHNSGRTGLAPHAPYTASLQATQFAVEKSRLESRLLSVHLAESIEEMEWLSHQSGPFSQLLAPFINAEYFTTLGTIAERLSQMSHAWRALVVHGNYLAPDELQFVAEHTFSMAVVLCPRTHAHFGHRHGSTGRYPLTERLEMGVRHLIGTDSRASNPDLNLWKEAQWIRRENPSLPAERVLRMVTIDAANFLDLKQRYGALREGYSANLTAIQLGSKKLQIDSLFDAILDSQTESFPIESKFARCD